MKNILPSGLGVKEISHCLMPGKWIVLCWRPKRSEWVEKNSGSACYEEVGKLKLSVCSGAYHRKPSDFVRESTTKWSEVLKWLFNF